MEIFLETARIKLVPPTMKFASQMLEAIRESQDELGVYLSWVPYALTESASIDFTKEAIENFAKFEQELRFSIFDKSKDRLVGTISLMIKDKSVPYFEIGYWLRSSEVGQGYVSEALGLVEGYAFNELQANRLEIRTAQTNLRSQAVAERCGYGQEAILLNERRLPSGELDNTLVYCKLAL